VIEPVVREYLLLGLRLGKLVDGFVDCWFGDPALWQQVADEPSPDPAALAREATRLLAALVDSGLAEDRRRYLAAQVRGLRCSAHRLSGLDIGFIAEVAAYFDVAIELGDTGAYAAAHAEIDALLPGTGDLGTRLAAFHERDRIPPARLQGAVEALSAELRTLARARFHLPDGDAVTYEVVGDRPWNAFNRYRGGFHSLVTLNADAGHGMSALPHLATHEVYPGHHTEHCVKEAGLVRDRGHAEHAISLVNTPQCLVTEGMAEAALDAALGDGWGPWTAGVLAGQEISMDGELVERLLPHTMKLLAARQDAAILLHDRGADPEDVVGYLRRWMLVGEDRARHMVRFLTDPLWRAYTVTYIEGSRLVRAWLGTDPAVRTARYRRLLTEPLLPSVLRAELDGAPS
jgi:hypothetical protein